MATMEIKVCDVCEEVGKPTFPYNVNGDGMTANVDLCFEDSETIRKFLNDYGKRKPGRRPAGVPTPAPVAKKTARKAGRPRGTTPRMTIEEIEASKK
jgi:hypothetical protein